MYENAATYDARKEHVMEYAIKRNEEHNGGTCRLSPSFSAEERQMSGVVTERMFLLVLPGGKPGNCCGSR